jgi:YD repeat-containing protein
MPNCRGCGTVVDPTDSEVNQGVDEILEASLKDAIKHGEICPLCGHSKAQPVSHRKSVQFGVLLLALLICAVLAVAYYTHRNTERQAAATDALKQVESNAQARELLGTPITIQGRVTGEVKQDETGWRELHLTIPVRGPKATGVLQITGGRENGPWKFSTLEVLLPELKKRANLITGRVVEYSPDAYQELHTEAISIPESVTNNVPPPTWDGDFPCIFADASPDAAPQLSRCASAIPMSAANNARMDRFETDLRRGSFIMRQTDLLVSEAGFDLPLTRTYTAQDWLPGNKSHAFGLNANHSYDIAPLGTRNPYTEQFLVLENGDFIYFPRVSTGTGYADAIYRHSETGTSFYGATQQWVGDGWLTKLRDGSTIHFPESYSAKNLAQGAASEMTDSSGNKIELVRSPNRNLLEIRGPGGSAIKFSYDDKDRVVRAEDNQGHWTKYAYNTDGYLTEVLHSSGAARNYEYVKGLLISVMDEQDRVLIHNTYDSDWLVGQRFGNGHSIQYHYDMAANRKYAVLASITFSDGSVKTVKTSDSVSDVYKRMK